MRPKVLNRKCDHCDAERGWGEVSNAELVDVFTYGEENSDDGLHKELGFPHKVYRTAICTDCIERYLSSNEFLDKLGADRILFYSADFNDYLIIRRSPKPTKH